MVTYIGFRESMCLLILKISHSCVIAEVNHILTYVRPLMISYSNVARTFTLEIVNRAYTWTGTALAQPSQTLPTRF